MNLQKLAFERFQPELRDLALSHLTAIEKRETLEEELAKLVDDKLLALVHQLSLRYAFRRWRIHTLARRVDPRHQPTCQHILDIGPTTCAAASSAGPSWSTCLSAALRSGRRRSRPSTAHRSTRPRCARKAPSRQEICRPGLTGSIDLPDLHYFVWNARRRTSGAQRACRTTSTRASTAWRCPS